MQLRYVDKFLSKIIRCYILFAKDAEKLFESAFGKTKGCQKQFELFLIISGEEIGSLLRDQLNQTHEGFLADTGLDDGDFAPLNVLQGDIAVARDLLLLWGLSERREDEESPKRYAD
jgi:hypothetical protein